MCLPEELVNLDRYQEGPPKGKLMRRIILAIALLVGVTCVLADSPPGSASKTDPNIVLAASSQYLVKPDKNNDMHQLYCKERVLSANRMMKQWVLKGISKEDFWKTHSIVESTPETKKELEDYVDRAYSHITDGNAVGFRTEEWDRCWSGK